EMTPLAVVEDVATPVPPTVRPRARQGVCPAQKNRPAGSREDLQRLNMEIPKALHKRLKLKAIYEDRTVTDIVLQAINEYLHSH
ncbi:MAG: hypothetical protein KJ041_11360, partial [Gammaproteobacteria bacterium]|nr:hypothetical protein [Gammaproteobacteria bacterium]